MDSWIEGSDDTPYFKKLTSKLFKLNYFIEADKKFQYQSLLKAPYDSLNDFVHTKGGSHSYTALNLSNCPRFRESTLASYITTCLSSCEVVAIGLSLRYPRILEPLPLNEKFGLKLPPCGFFTHWDVSCLANVIDSGRLEQIRNIIKDDEQVQGIRNWILSLPDLTEDEWQTQIAERFQDARAD